MVGAVELRVEIRVQHQSHEPSSLLIGEERAQPEDLARLVWIKRVWKRRLLRGDVVWALETQSVIWAMERIGCTVVERGRREEGRLADDVLLEDTCQKKGIRTLPP